MRRAFFSILCILLASVVWANPITLQQAQQIAAQYKAAKSKSRRAPSVNEMKPHVVLDAVNQQGEPYLYAVSFEEQGGYVIISGDDRFREVLAYSDTGDFSNEDMPCNMRAWLQSYVDEMKHLDAAGYQPKASGIRRSSAIKTAIAPLIQTLWNQNKPYNNKCPKFLNTEERCVTGCVATAMAQVVYYTAFVSGWKPTKTLAAIPAYTCRTNWSGYGQMSVGEVPVTTFDWANMAYTSTDDGATAVATLMECCGKSVKMNYANSASGGSSAYSTDIPHALKTYFGYSPAVRRLARSNYSISTWTNIVYDELKAARPVIYSGHSSGGGHSFVVDGYDGDELFHVNWGWGGNSNGFFALTVMNSGDNSGIGASSTTDGYSYDQDIIVDIKIASEEDKSVLTTKSLRVSGTTIYWETFNKTGVSQNFSYGLGFIDNDGTIEVLCDKGSSPCDQNMGPGDPYYTMTNNLSYAGMTKKIVPISKLASSITWLTDVDPNYMYVEAVYDESGNVTLTAHPVPSITVTGITFPGSKYQNEEQQVVVNLKNTGEEYYGRLYLFASTTETKGTALRKEGITITKNGTATLSFDWTPTSAATYNIWIAEDEAGSKVLSGATTTVTISVNAHAPTGYFMISAINAVNCDQSSWTTDGSGNILADVVSKKLVFSPSITNISGNNYGSASFTIQVYRKNGDSWVKLSRYFTLSASNFSSGSSKKWNDLDFGEVGYGQYKIALMNGSTPYDERYILNLTNGYSTIDKEGNPVLVKTTSGAVTVDETTTAIDLSGFDFTHVTPNSNPNTLYILSSSQTAPASLSGKNVIKNGVAANITLTDGNAFCSPIDFTATNISYTRTISSFYDNGKNWTTITLPFAASEITNFDGSMEWIGSDKQFWIMKFTGESGSNVIFEYAPKPLEANTPYIIALPGAAYGTYSLVGKNTLTFKATNAAIKAGAKAVTTCTNYKFVGTTANPTLTDIYALNATGDMFVKSSSTIEPFRAYFAPTTTSSATSSLGIGFVGSGETTGIDAIRDTQPAESNGAVYNLNGQRVEKPAKGLYIVNGKKVVIK